MTTSNNAITSKNFNAKLAGFVKSATSQRDTLQGLIVFAAEHYASVDKNGDVIADSGFLTKLLKESVGIRSLATGTLQAYIQAHTNLVWTTPKDGEPAFRKAKGSEFKADLAALNSTVWYLHDNRGQAKGEFKVDTYAKRVLAKLQKEGLSASDFIKLLQEGGK